jgi:hypothetical protein
MSVAAFVHWLCCTAALGLFHVKSRSTNPTRRVSTSRAAADQQQADQQQADQQQTGQFDQCCGVLEWCARVLWARSTRRALAQGGQAGGRQAGAAAAAGCARELCARVGADELPPVLQQLAWWTSKRKAVLGLCGSRMAAASSTFMMRIARPAEQGAGGGGRQESAFYMERWVKSSASCASDNTGTPHDQGLPPTPTKSRRKAPNPLRTNTPGM